jgi:hypothetical protein
MKRDVLIRAITGYMRRNPREVARTIRSLIGLRLGVPLDAVRWFGEQASNSGKAEDVEIDSVPPGIRVAATIDLMKTTVRASSIVYIERMVVNGEQIRVEVRLEKVALQLVEDSDSPVAMLIKSGALDLSRPGNLVRHLPDRPPFLIEAIDNRIVLDLMKHPKIAKDERLRRAAAVLLPLVTVRSIQTDPEHLDVALRAVPAGLGEVVLGFRRALGLA